MAEQLGDLTRTHTCGALRPSDVRANVVLLGWVHRVRDLGGLLFVDVRDREGVTQVVFDNDDAAQMVKAKRLRSEYVIGVQGTVRRRSPETINPKLGTGTGPPGTSGVPPFGSLIRISAGDPKTSRLSVGVPRPLLTASPNVVSRVTVKLLESE